MNEKPRPVGRPPQGITKKVSLTLTEEEWHEIDQSGKTVAAFLKNKMKKNVPVPILVQRPEWKQERNPVTYPRRHAEEQWDVHWRFSDKPLPPDDIIEAAKQSMYQILFPDQAENAVVETRDQYVCPFTGKRFGSMDKLVSSAIPTLVQWAIAKKRRDAERQAAKEREKGQK
ncbi:hypothetical protein [Paenibacillus sp. UASWS1643]|uniref:hypothetical protein n=1 Tax=Paenibacillus sp. UASWS1643 TaxID=2580422 RepID=UPI001684BDF5|nr:hypothetical protein [Paenibacillus sp. UASWS1643]